MQVPKKVQVQNSSLVPHLMGNDEDGLIVVALIDGAAVVSVAHARNPGKANHRILRLVSVVQI